MSRISPHPNPVAQEILDLLAERPNLPEKDLKFAITHILNGNGHNGKSRAADADHSQQQEIFDRQPPELQEFMLQTALLPQSEKLPRFCNALLAIDDAETHLQAMADDKLLGDRAFAEFMRHKVKQDEAAYQELCLKTAKILDANIRSKESIDLFVQAEAWEKAADLIEEYGIE
ncbi:MAG: hypothetical protein GY850_17990, partial [bacterium]|nr:hypothetical protein [bacterium]